MQLHSSLQCWHVKENQMWQIEIFFLPLKKVSGQGTEL